MITLLFLCYAALCTLAFKLFRVPANTWTVSTSVLGGLFGIGGIIVALNYNQPFTPDARILFYTTPIFSTVIGRVIDVPVKANVPVKKGDVLFQLDPEPFKDTVKQRKAELAQAEQRVKILAASLDEAKGKEAEALAARDRAKQAYDRYSTGNEEAGRHGSSKPFSEIEVANRKGEFDEAQAALVVAHGGVVRAQLTYESSIGGINTDVARLRAEVAKAEFELSQATVRAPTDGYATQLFLKPGMAAMPMPIRPVMVFVHGEDNIFAASFSQNVVQRIRAGDEAEIAFNAIPGGVFRGRVQRLVETVAQGQLQPSGDLILPEQKSQMPGRATIIIDIVDDLSAYQLPAGSSAQVAVYTEYWQHLAIVRRILLRMKSWLNYLTILN